MIYLLNKIKKKYIIYLDFPLLLSCLTLLVFGVIMVTSASSEIAAEKMGNPFYFAIHHMLNLFIGFIVFVLTIIVPMEKWKNITWQLLILTFIVLALVLTPGIGHKVNGSMRWIRVGGILNIQPSEISKIFIIFFIAGYLIRRKSEIRNSWLGILKLIILILPLLILLLKQPDFGSTIVIILSIIAMLFISGMSLCRLIVIVLLTLCTVIFLIYTHPYRVARVLNFINPWLDPFGSGYQLSQALIAFGRGGLYGVGLGNSIQKQFYLPEAHTDFIFAVFAEEFGIFGSLITLFLFLFISIRAVYIGILADKKKFSSYVSYGIGCLWLFQSMINICVNIGLLPTKGLTLPFFSYGGTSMIICCMCLGILCRVYLEHRTNT